jgi:hypothetical protein
VKINKQLQFWLCAASAVLFISRQRPFVKRKVAGNMFILANLWQGRLIFAAEIPGVRATGSENTANRLVKRAGHFAFYGDCLFASHRICYENNVCQGLGMGRWGWRNFVGRRDFRYLSVGDK